MYIITDNILSVTNPIKEGYKGICLVSFDMGFEQPYKSKWTNLNSANF